jgi:hypothetical protein
MINDLLYDVVSTLIEHKFDSILFHLAQKLFLLGIIHCIHFNYFLNHTTAKFVEWQVCIMVVHLANYLLDHLICSFKKWTNLKRCLFRLFFKWHNFRICDRINWVFRFLRHERFFPFQFPNLDQMTVRRWERHINLDIAESKWLVWILFFTIDSSVWKSTFGRRARFWEKYPSYLLKFILLFINGFIIK